MSEQFPGKHELENSGEDPIERPVRLVALPEEDLAKFGPDAVGLIPEPDPDQDPDVVDAVEIRNLRELPVDTQEALLRGEYVQLPPDPGLTSEEFDKLIDMDLRTRYPEDYLEESHGDDPNDPSKS